MQFAGAPETAGSEPLQRKHRPHDGSFGDERVYSPGLSSGHLPSVMASVQPVQFCIDAVGAVFPIFGRIGELGQRLLIGHA